MIALAATLGATLALRALDTAAEEASIVGARVALALRHPPARVARALGRRALDALPSRLTLAQLLAEVRP